MTTRKTRLSKRLLSGFFGVGAIVALAACAPETAEVEPAPDTAEEPAMEEPAAEDPMADDDAMAEGDTIVDIAADNEDFSTLVEAIEAAGLEEVLASDGPFTVFAPTNEAFEALPEGALDALLLPENQDVLVQVLTYHVVPAAVLSDELESGDVPTVEGSTVMIEVTDDGVMVNEAMVTEADIEASNGVLHAIDQVLLPPAADL